MRPIIATRLGLAALVCLPLWSAAGCGSDGTQSTTTGGHTKSTGEAGSAGATGTAGNGGGTGTGAGGSAGGGGTAGGGGSTCVPSPELCDGIDNNCDGVIDENCACKDGETKACYTGDPATEGIGVCHGGTSTCDLSGVFGPCVGEVTPTAEVCDGLDNDCNGTADEGLGQTTCGLGICQVIVDNCVGGVPQTCTPLTSAPEACNGLDDDCNGTIDDGCSCVDGDQQSCYSGPLSSKDVGECKGGTQLCQGGKWGPCDGEVVPQSETCNGKDDDCNGQVDDGLGTSVCGVGECQKIVDNCAAGAVETCTPGDPSPETCDGKDNDCNGTVDDGLGTLSCGVGACANTVPSCSEGQDNTCVPLAPQPETCDGVDNDCNGAVDDGDPGGGGACDTGKAGACAPGVLHCLGGSLACVQSTQPSAETCDGKDNDCNGQVDEGDPGGGLTCDTGKLGVCAAGTTACTNGAIACNQNVASSAETCDGKDNDCNGQVDDGNPGGGLACDTGKLGICAAGTTACTNGAIACNQNAQPVPETCDGLDNDCNGQADDGNPGGGLACDTGKLGICAAGTTACSNGAIACNQNAVPSAETCDGLDNDCNGLVDDGNPGGGLACDTGKLGVCAAGTTACTNGSIACNQNTQSSAETCDGKDNDCNGQVDDGDPGGGAPCNTGKLGVCAAGTIHCVGGSLQCVQNVQPSAETCDGKDNDCDGAVDNGDPGGGKGCNTGKLGVCAAGTTACTNGAIACNQNVQPSAETCDGLDNDCNGVVDNGNPGGGLACNTGKLGVCAAGTTACTGGSVACNQNVQASAEVCDGLDNDCDGTVDEGVKTTFYRDADGDGYGNAGVTAQACSAPAGYVSNASDCNDGNAAVHPGAAEVCNGVDDNCNGQVDEGVLSTFYRDADGDGYGNPGVTTQACSAPGGYVGDASDCNDGNGSVHPGAAEACNGVDDNCDGQVDEGNPGGGAWCGGDDCNSAVTACSGGTIVCVNTPFPDGTYCGTDEWGQTAYCYGGTCNWPPSCPWVFTWNGSEFAKDNDVYSTAGKGPMSEYKDYYLLRKPLLPKDGHYELELREVDHETSYTDQVGLVVVDHAADVGVGVDETGAVSTFGPLTAPTAAHDGAGNDVLAQVESQDDLGFKGYNDDTLTLDFSAMDLSQGATFVMRAHGFLSDSDAGAEIKAPPRIFIQTQDADGTWVTRHFWYPRMDWSTGAYDLSPYLGTSKLVRLLWASCNIGKYHLLDAVGMDNQPRAPAAITLLPPVSALHSTVGDVLPYVLGSDNIYSVMGTGESVRFTFDMPSLAAGNTRDFVFVSEGYYVATAP